jgi:hypothetical protein
VLEEELDLEERLRHVAELELWHAAHDAEVLRSGDRAAAIAAADGSSPSVRRDRLQEDIKEMLEVVENLRKIAQHQKICEMARLAAKEAHGAIRVLVPNPDAAPLVAQVMGSTREYVLDTAPRWIEVVLTPHELREAAMRKAGLLDEPGIVVPR